MTEYKKSLATLEHFSKDLNVEDWDGYGAPPLNEKLITHVRNNVLIPLSKKGVEEPQVVPGQGIIQLEWDFAHIDRFMEFEIRFYDLPGQGIIFVYHLFYGDEKDDKTWQEFEPVDLDSALRFVAGMVE